MAESNLENTRSRVEGLSETIGKTLRDNDRLRLFTTLSAPVSVLVLFFILPLVVMLYLSFLEELPPAPFTLANYIEIFSTDLYVSVILRTLYITVETTAIVCVIGYTLAYSIVRFSKRTTLLLLLIILPFWTNYIIRMYAWINILQKGGVVDTIFVWLGLVSNPGGYMFTHQAVLIGFVYVWIPLATLPFYASLNDLNQDLIDAAMDLGAGPIKTFFTVTLPLTKDGIIAGIVLVSIPTFGSFVTPALLGGPNVFMIGMVIENQFTSAFNWPFGSALGMVVSAFVVSMLFLSMKLATNLLTGGADQ